MISFIDEHRCVFGVEPICRLLPIAPSTYYEKVFKRLDVDRLSVRARSDISLKIEIRRAFEQNFRVDGVRKVWRQSQREGFDAARCTFARLMRSMSLQGVIRGKPIRTTVSDKLAPSPLDRMPLMRRVFCLVTALPFLWQRSQEARSGRSAMRVRTLVSQAFVAVQEVYRQVVDGQIA